ncbi:hypothetical protein BDZ89DRAFT_1046809 [Hymenopellis radicata]|nr:hypothetical protein BDZ89DRAFT_1046809 [Hymenopellis radicata]
MSHFLATVIGEFVVAKVVAGIFVIIPLKVAAEHTADARAIERYAYLIATSDPVEINFTVYDRKFSEIIITAKEHVPALTPFINDMKCLPYFLSDHMGLLASDHVQLSLLQERYYPWYFIFLGVCCIFVGFFGALFFKCWGHADFFNLRADRSIGSTSHS